MRAIVVLTAVIGCTGGGGGGGCNGNGGGAADLELANENNYTYEGLLDIEAIDIAAAIPGQEPYPDATIDWSGVTVDIRGRPLDPSSVQQLAVLGVGKSLEETVGLIERNELDASQDAYLFDNVDGVTSASLSDFNIIGAYLNLGYLEEDAEKTYIVSMLNVENGITDLLMSTVFVPKEASENHQIDLTNDSAKLTVEVDLHSSPALVTEADKGPYTLDWSAVTKDVFGAEFQSLLGDQLIIGRYDTEDIGEIEAGFLQLDSNAVELYRANVFGVTKVDLEEATTDDGVAFPGFTADGTWLVGVVCTTCITPVPLILSIVDVN